MRIVIRHDEAGQWWWTVLGERGGTAAISRLYSSRWECMRAVAELKVEGPTASVTYEEPYAAMPMRHRVELALERTVLLVGIAPAPS